jgi:DNA polymerase III subunit alpha
VEGYDESFEFRIFDEEYLKFRHFLLQNQFAFFKITVKEGWVNRETGKKSDPRIQFIDVKMLADVLPTFAKKLILQLAINEVKEGVISELNQIFTQHKGDHNVTFEVMELEKIKRMVEEKPVAMIPTDTEDEMEENFDEMEEMNIAVPAEKEEIVVKTKLVMPSRKLKVKISSELLQELERMQLSFRLN